MTSSRIRAVLLTAAALALLAGPALAETYTVSLRSGSTMLTRYQPQEASWDKDMILVLSEVGNWVALQRQDITGITSDTNNRGFGKRINATTVVLGWSANDLEEDAAAGAMGVQPPERSYDQNQFVDPEDLRGGLPATIPGGYSGGGYTGSLTPQAPPPTQVSPPTPEGGATQ